MFREILNTIGTKIASAVIALLILILTTQYLGADGRGLVSLIYSSIGIIGIFAGFVGGPAVIYLASKHKLIHLLFPVYTWILLVAIAGSGLIWYLQLVPAIYVIPVGVLAITSSVFVVNLYLLVGHRKVEANNHIYLIQWIINLITLGAFFIVLNQPEVEYVVLSLFISNILGIILTIYALYQLNEPGSFHWKEEFSVIRSIISVSFFAQAAAIMYYLYYRLGIFVLNFSFGLFAVGVFSVGVNIAEFILLASQSLALVGYSRISNTDDREYAKKITIILTKFGFMLTACITLIMLVMPSSVYGLVFGKDFIAVPQVLVTMSPGIVAFGTSIIIFNYFAGVGKNTVNAAAAFIGLCSNVLLCYLLVPIFGIAGAGISSSVSFIIMSGILFGVFFSETQSKIGDLMIRRADFIFLLGKLKDYIRSHSSDNNPGARQTFL